MRAALLSAIVASAAANLVALHEPSTIPAGWRKTNEEPASGAMFRVNVGVKRQNVKALEALSRDVSDPREAKYLEYPSYEEMGELVRPAASDSKVVKEWLAEHGVAVQFEHPHGDYITGVASLATLSKMANGDFETFEHAASGSKIYRLTSGVMVPAEVASAVDTFTGFHGFPLEPRKISLGEGAGVVTPKFFRDTYNVSQVAKSGHTNIQAIAQFQGQYVDSKDLADFCKKYDGGADCVISKFIGENKQKPGVESMLDTEYIMSLSETATTWVYSYPNIDFCSDLTVFGANVTGSAVHPSVISISYGSQKIGMCSSALVQRFAQDVQKMGTMGISVMISSGDDGSGGETRQGSNGGKLSPSFPASIPTCTAVGATFFVSGSSGEEEATTQFGSGGGFSYDFTSVPTYQAADVSGYLATVTKPNAQFATGRGSPDVSALGESFTVIDHGIAIAVGGTSCSSPSFAALMTLLNEVCLAQSGKTLGFLNPLFYQNPSMFTDVVKGTNAIGENSKAGWSAIKGWDASTGLGTPAFDRMLAVVKKTCTK
eukprot:TRINITY_DN701_c0_g1_i1.p2 TRINITY_DN701_c0_g1~~TRINITY_DN701_c0_g1_i1.p2  ORF type:complete len:545 (+),score=167.30 TRINITY_DN701_c0_g1_i1:46-1680(+)